MYICICAGAFRTHATISPYFEREGGRTSFMTSFFIVMLHSTIEFAGVTNEREQTYGIFSTRNDFPKKVNKLITQKSSRRRSLWGVARVKEKLRVYLLSSG